MNEQFRSRFEAGLQQIADSLTKKGRVKQEDKVHQRIERLKKGLTLTPTVGFTFCCTSLHSKSEENVWDGIIPV